MEGTTVGEIRQELAQHVSLRMSLRQQQGHPLAIGTVETSVSHFMLARDFHGC